MFCCHKPMNRMPLTVLQVSQITLPYTDCGNQGSNFSDLPGSEYQLRSSDSNVKITTPRWLFDNSSGQHTCVIQFDVPADLQHPVFIYYKLTNFFQNHRRYVQSFDTNQLKGQFVSVSSLDNGNCKPLSSIKGTAIYPCGLIANSLFNGDLVCGMVHLPALLIHGVRYFSGPHDHQSSRGWWAYSL
jgi:hypothetical protein